MSKQTIAQIEARKRKLLLRLRRDANELVKLEDQLKDMRTGKRKVAPPPGKVHKISRKDIGEHMRANMPDFNDCVDIVRPVAPGSTGPC
jgi:hypothetical protein